MKAGFRLSKASDFERVRRLGLSYAHPFVVLITLANGLQKARIGVAAGRSVGKAVERNRAKRILRATITPLLDKIDGGHDILLLAREGIRGQSSPSVQLALAHLLQRAGLSD